MWQNYTKNTLYIHSLDFLIDISRMGLTDTYLTNMQPAFDKAIVDMEALERGELVNKDENRMVGHYWLRCPELAPTETIQREIRENLKQIKDFSHQVHTGAIQGAQGPFKNLLCIGIGGSALGPQLVASALGHPKKDRLKIYFIDNTDPDGIDCVLSELEGKLGETLCIVTSKSGSTPEPKNAMTEVEAAYKKAQLHFKDHAVAITSNKSILDEYAHNQGWILSFPMWDWVGGRTSELASVGLLPAALQGIDIEKMLEGAKKMDEHTRIPSIQKNPAALLALAWYFGTGGKGQKDMVILPYKDRLMLLSRYLQQLVMESLGKEMDRNQQPVYQGIAVYGNKGSTDQHAYIQQLRDGVHNFFVTFIEVLKDREGKSIEIEPGVNAGDYLQAFLLGTRESLTEKNRGSITITIKEVTPSTIGMLIALYERAVSFYASFVNINAYHQPGVEAGKKAATAMLNLKARIVKKLQEKPGHAMTAEEIAQALGQPNQTEIVFKLLKHLATNPDKNIFETAKEPFYATTFMCMKG